MSQKPKPFAAPASSSMKTKRPQTVSVASGSSRVPSTVMKVKQTPANRAKFNKSSTLSESDVSMIKPEGSMPDFDAEYRQIAYGKFLRAALEECLVDEKIKREETHMDIQMCLLADRFQKTASLLNKTNKRLKEVSFVVEQKRLLDLKANDSDRFFEMTDSSNAQEMVQNLAAAEQTCLNKLKTKNINFGFDKDSGHKQLLDAVNDAIDGLELIKKHSNLDINKFREYEKTQKYLKELNKDKLLLDRFKGKFEANFPKLNEQVFLEASEKISMMMEDDADD